MNVGLAQHWVPSHVQVTIHQAKELHLKNKTGHSELYVSLEVDKERFTTVSFPKQTDPQWNEEFTIPLMSLVTTIHITVRQKGRFGDSYLGYFTINPGNFKISPNQVTHWYKLGPKPGKSSTKLRGDLQVSLKFLSEWSGQVKQSRGVGSAELVRAHKGMLKRSSSDLKIRSMRDIEVAEGLLGRPNQSKSKKEILSSLRRSFRRKNKTQAFERCEDEFTSFTSHSATSTPQNIRKRTNSCIPDNGSNSFSSIGHLSNLSNGFSDSDNSVSPSPLPVRTSNEPLVVGDSEGGVPNEGGEGASSANDNSLRTEKEKEREDASNGGVQDGKITSAAKFYNFRSKKKPWSMHQLPITTPSPTSRSLEKVLGQGHSLEEREEEALEEDGNNNTSQTPEESEVTSFKYRSRTSIASRSFRETSGSRLISKKMNQENISENDSLEGSKKGLEREGESGYSSDRVIPSSLSEEGSGPNSAEGSKTELNGAGSSERTKKKSLKSPPTKTHPYSRRVDIVTPRSGSPGAQKSRPRNLAYGKTDDDESRIPKTSPALLNRRSTLATIPTARRLLPATPIPRKTQQAVTPEAKRTSPSSENKPQLSANKRLSIDSSFAAKLVTSLQDVASNDCLCCNNNKEDEAEVGKLTGGEEEPRRLLHTTPSSSSTSINSKEDQTIGNQKVKHTVQYKKSSPLFNKGFQPVSLFPPSMSDYTNRSQTLPSRGKVSRRLSGSMNGLSACGGTDFNDKKISLPVEASIAQQSPTNTRLIRRSEQMNYVHPKSASPRSSISGGISETDDGESDIKKPSTLEGKTDRNAPSASKPTTVKYGGKTPGEIVTQALRNRKQTGGLKKTIKMYQENRKHSAIGQRRSEEKRLSPSEPSSRESNRQQLLETAVQDRASYSASSSPLLRRSHSRAEAARSNSFFNSLRRTRSSIFTSSSSTPRPVSSGNFNEDETDSGSSIINGNQSSPPLEMERNAAQKTSAPGLLMFAQKHEVSTSDDKITDEDQKKPDILIRVRTATMTSADSSSIQTLTDTDSRVVAEQRHSPNPAAATAASGSHVRHTTSSSVESEGFHSVTSEDEDMALWSKEELVKEVMHTREKLESKTEELEAMRTYMDNILARIMETNPSILSTS